MNIVHTCTSIINGELMTATCGQIDILHRLGLVISRLAFFRTVY